MVKKKIVSGLLAVTMVLGAAVPTFAQEQKLTLSGTVTALGSEAKTTLSLVAAGSTQAAHSVAVSGSKGSYTLEGVDPGRYLLRAEKSGYVTREYEVNLSTGSLTQDVKLCLLGDVTGDGKINVADTSRTYSHVRGSSVLTDAYVLSCANINGDSRLNVADVSMLYSLVRNPVVPIPPIPSNPVEDEPVDVAGTLEFSAPVQGGHLTPYQVYRVSGTSLVIKDAYAYVVYNGVTYEAENGVVTVPDLYSSSTNLPVCLSIGNRDTKDRTFTVNLVYPQGHQMNPMALANGTLSTFCKAGNDQGVYYRFTASKAGTLTIRLNEQVDCNITITSETVEGGTRSISLSDTEGGNSLSFKMSEGEAVIVCIGMNPTNGFNYPEATVSTTVRFR